MNSVCLVGRLTKDPELRTVNDDAVVNFTVAVNRPFKNRNGEYDADFIRCNAWGKTATFIEQYFHKGKEIKIEGWIKTSRVEKGGETKWYTDVEVRQAGFTGSKSDDDSGDTGFFGDPPEEQLPFDI